MAKGHCCSPSAGHTGHFPAECIVLGNGQTCMPYSPATPYL